MNIMQMTVWLVGECPDENDGGRLEHVSKLNISDEF